MNSDKISHKILDVRVPDHLKPFLAQQDPNLYTPMDHVAWRFIMRLAVEHLKKHAHGVYLSGLEATGISLEHIPLISEMDQKLRHFGWGAVPVNGFIPPAVFMEFQALGLLPIACEMRTLQHLEYTPAPDIVHEAAGHAPILADRGFSNYLKRYGDAAKMAILSHQDVAVYEAIRHLSIVKEDPASTAQEIIASEEALKNAWSEMNFTSEALQLARLNWWTAEYGLIGDLDAPKIYGAGLLSSLGESESCLGDGVQRLPFSLQSIATSYDITKPQPQLFVTPSFEALTERLAEFESTMAFKTGGSEGMAKALQAQTVCTYALDSGLEISGALELTLFDSHTNAPIFLKTKGATQLCFNNKELPGHSVHTHAHGYSTPIGIEKTLKKPLNEATEAEIRALNGHFRYQSGFEVRGNVIEIISRNESTILIRLDNCTVTRGEKIYYQPQWGVFDLACGDEIVSVFGGPSDRVKYLQDIGGYRKLEYKPKYNQTEFNKRMNDLVADFERQNFRSRMVTQKEFESSLQSLKSCPNYARDGWVVLLDQFVHEKASKEIRDRVKEELESFSKTTSTMTESLSARIPRAYKL